ncbi:PepSY domain-containing protein [Shewanella dokdonensis]|uniref:PepSY domain-containing protein n=2 Tax=Shewanella dokdonensis TaxID=712036 RepID=A0ABX8DGB9_9GAMM|nr:PepSY domain-containing protein [Shewanella dokdonensis]QVK23804.1 PepSY domain-containing protein [Shewanella dokdonensis]
MSGNWRQRISFRIHQWLGLASALVLLVVGATGALLALEDDITAMWPRPEVAVAERLLPMPELAPKLQLPGKMLQRIYLESEPQLPGRALYQDRQSKQREWRIFNPYTGEILGARPAISEFFAEVMALHRWLLLPNSIGSVITGTAALMAIILLIAGFIRRAPDRLSSIKDWLWWKRGSKGRLALWQFHAVLGTWLFIPIFIMALTGPWFAFDWYRSGLKQLLASPEPPTIKADANISADADAVWRSFLAVKPDGRYARWYLPREANGEVRVRYLEPDAPHSRAYSALTFDAAGHLLQQQRYAELRGGDYLLANMYAFHTGSYFGLPGRVIWSLSGLAFGSFAITGIWLFFNRRARPKEQASGTASTLIAYASQSGTAAAYGQRLKLWLEQQGQGVHLRSMANMQPQEFGAYQQVLLLAATYGEGQAPDSALLFQQQLAAAAVKLNHVNVAVLAFGDRQYQQFCAFGHWLAQRFSELGAATLLPLQEVDRGAEQALQDWSDALAQTLKLEHASLAADSWQSATLLENRCLNPGSDRPVHHLELALQGSWQAGDILEVLPIWSESRSRQHLQLQGLDGDVMVSTPAGIMPLWQAQAQYLEAFTVTEHGLTPQAYANAAAPLTARSYSIASMDNALQLMVRRVLNSNGFEGRASGALATAKVGSEWQVRLKPHSNFHLPPADVPLILLGAGTGLAPYLGF